MNYSYLNMPVNKEVISDINYSQSNIGNNPTVNLATGRMQYVFQDADIGATNFAINVAHVYNSKLNNAFAQKILGLGNNWKLNLSQFIIADNYDGSTGLPVLKYMDESGEIHRYVSFGTNKWYNERKATSIIEKVSGNYVLSDGVGNKLYFDSNGYLINSISCQNSNILKKYIYDANHRLISVYDNRKQDNHIDLAYNSDGNLEKMIAYVKGTRPVTGLRYEYDANNNLTAVYKIAYGRNSQKVAEKQILEFCYENNNLVIIIDTESKTAKSIRYGNGQKVSKLSDGFVQEKCIASGMTDSANKSLSMSSNLETGVSCEPTFVEKSYNTFKYDTSLTSDGISVVTDVTNECNIVLRYYIDRKACITSSFEYDRWFGKEGVNLKTLTKYDGQFIASDKKSDLGYINGCATFLTNKGKFSKSISPNSIVNNLPMQIYSCFNYSFWLKTKKNYSLLEVKAVYKINEPSDNYTGEKTILVNAQAVGAWQRVDVPLYFQKRNGFSSFYTLDISFLANKIACSDDFEITDIGVTPSPGAELMLRANKSVNLPLSTVTKVKLTLDSGMLESVDVGANLYLTESDIISTYTNKYKSNSESFDLICNNGTKRRSGITEIQYYFPLFEWSDYTDSQPFYIHTVFPTKDANIKTYYVYEGDGFTIKNDYAKTIDGKDYNSSTSVKMDYKGKTLYEIDEYGTKNNYRYYSDGNLKQFSVINGSDTQSIQTYEYDFDGKLISVDNGLGKQTIMYDDESQSIKTMDYSYQNSIMTDTGISETTSIGIFRDKSVCVTEYNGQKDVGSKKLTYENGQIRTISDGLVKYGVQYNYLKDCVTYTQFDGNTEKPIQLDAVSQYNEVGGKYYRTHTSKFYDEKGKIIDSSSVEVDAYGKPIELSKGSAGTYKYETGNGREKYRYVYPESQESEFIKKPSICKNLNDYSTTEYKYDNDGKLIGWKETESQNTMFEVRQIAPTTTKYIFGNNEQEYFVQINHDKNKMASPRIESIVVQKDKRTDVDKPANLFEVNYSWTPLGDIKESIADDSVEKYDYISHHNNSLLESMNYRRQTYVYGGAPRINTVSNTLQYYDNGLVKQEIVTSQLKQGFKTFDPVSSTRTYQYDNLHRITKEVNSKFGVNRTYSYNSDGRLKSVSGYQDDVRKFAYDSKGRLISINGTTTFTYDHFGNRISKTVNGVTSTYKYDVGGRLVSAGGVDYSYNADGIRCKKTAIGSAKGERMYLDGGKILGEDRGNCRLRYFYDATGLKRIGLILENGHFYYECIKDSQGSIIAILRLSDNTIAAQYEYDALGKCKVLINDDKYDIASKNPFRWKGFFYDSETGFYYANGNYYDPETGMYVDAAPVSTVIENAHSSRHIDRNGTLCYNHLAIVGSPYTAFTTVEMNEDPTYDPGQTWWEKICDWWRNVPKWIKIGIGLIVIVALIIATIATGGAAGGLAGAVCAGALKGAVIGATSGAVISGTIEGLISAHNNQGFWDGFANGAADGFMFGAITGAIAGGINGYYQYQPTKINGFSKHGINGAIDGKGHGVNERALLDAVKNPKQIIPQELRSKFKFIGKDSVVVLNKRGEVITTWARHRVAWRL